MTSSTRAASMKRFAVGLALFAAAPLAAQTPVNWDSLGAETQRVLAAYLQINTTNPPGNELETARFLQKLLADNGIESQILDTTELGPGRANLYARIRGNGSKKAIALVSHMDVVPVTPAFWSVDAFGGVVKDGFLYGRGALDMKGEGIAALLGALAIKRSGVPLNRDIVIIANADEELGGTGAATFVTRHPDLLKDVEFLITEGGANPLDQGRLLYYGVSVSEKRTFWQRLTVHGIPSHGSRPTKHNPVPRLVQALDKIAHYETPLRVTPGVRKYLHDLSTQFTGVQASWLANVDSALKVPAARDWILGHVEWNAILRNTISETGLSGSNKTNVIPAEATAELDIRLLPDQDTAAFKAELLKVVNDTAVHWTTILPPKPALESPIETDLFRAIERAARDRDPKALITTVMLTGATDRPAYRALNIVTYGLDPFKVELDDDQRGVHGNDERISLENLKFGPHFIYDILRYVQ